MQHVCILLPCCCIYVSTYFKRYIKNGKNNFVQKSISLSPYSSTLGSSHYLKNRAMAVHGMHNGMLDDVHLLWCADRQMQKCMYAFNYFLYAQKSLEFFTASERKQTEGGKRQRSRSINVFNACKLQACIQSVCKYDKGFCQTHQYEWNDGVFV